MNLNERLEQCRKDKAAIEKEEQELLKRIKQKEKQDACTFANMTKFTTDCGGRLILYLTPSFVKNVIKHAEHVVAFDKCGDVTCYKPNKIDKNALMFNYLSKNIQILFEQI